MSQRCCPCCKHALVGGRLGPVDLDVCPRCGGLWFDSGELSRTVAAGPRVLRRLYEGAAPRLGLAEAPAEGSPACPACRTTLAGVTYPSMPGITLDACPSCEGFWVMRNVLLRVVTVLEGTPRPAAPPEVPAAQPVPFSPPVAAPPLMAAEEAPVPTPDGRAADAAVAERIDALEREVEEWRNGCLRAAEERIAALEAEVEESRDRCLRTAEEMEDACRRLQREVEQERKRASTRATRADREAPKVARKGDRVSLRTLLAPLLGPSRPAAAPPDGAAAAEEPLAALQREVETWRDRCRQAAEALERARRSQREAEAERQRADERVITDLLPVLDNFSRALASTEQSSNVEALREGVELIGRQLADVLARHGLERIEALGQPFDPHLHEAIMQVEPREGQEPRQVVEELQAGFRLHDRVLRPPLVKVTSD